jgi:hypothetical protein
VIAAMDEPADRFGDVGRQPCRRLGVEASDVVGVAARALDD